MRPRFLCAPLLAVLGLAAVAAAFVTPGAAEHLRAVVDSLRSANPSWLLIAVSGYTAAYLTSVGAWRTAIHAAGGRIGFGAALARLGIGSVVNTVAPARVGDALKVALLTDAFDGNDRIWTAGGLYAAVAASRAVSIATLVIAASAAGALPLWPALALVAAAAALVGLGLSPLPLRRFHRLAHAVAGPAALARSPRRAAKLLAWSTGTTLCRLGATTAVAVALGLSRPLVAGLLIATALDAAGMLPLTPGNIGVAGGAVAVALASRGVNASHALGVAVAVQGLETCVSLAAGAAGAAHFAGARRVSPWVLRAAAVGGGVAFAAAGAALVVALV